MTYPIHEANIAGAISPVEWTSVCHSRTPFLWISFDPFRSVGRWGCEERARKFEVTFFCRSRVGLGSHRVGHYKSIEAARAAARRFAERQAAVVAGRAA